MISMIVWSFDYVAEKLENSRSCSFFLVFPAVKPLGIIADNEDPSADSCERATLHYFFHEFLLFKAFELVGFFAHADIAWCDLELLVN